MLSWIAERLRKTRGQSLVEFALIAPMFLILIFGVIDFGMGLRAYITVSQATREGARSAAIGMAPGTFTTGGAGDCNGSTNTTVVGKVCATMDSLGLSNLSEVSVTYPDGVAPGNSVRVHAEYEYDYITPLSAVVSFFTGGSLGGSVTVSSTTDMRLE